MSVHTVALRSTGGGLIVPVGTIQWSWALDGYSHHVDTSGNETKVDPRLQALTRNIVRQLVGSECPVAYYAAVADAAVFRLLPPGFSA